MPIKGVTDGGAALPRVGVLRKGAMRDPKNPNKPGVDLGWFRLQTDDPVLAKRFADVYGSQPKEINILLPYPTLDENFQAWQEEWVAGGMVHRCDSETTVLWRDDRGMSHEPRPCPGGCGMVGRLDVIVPQIGRGVVLQVLTTSRNDIRTIQANLRAVAGLNNNNLQNVPMVLRRQTRLISTPDPRVPGKRLRREVSLLSIEADERWMQVYLTAVAQRAQIAQIAQPSAPADERYEPDADGDESITPPDAEWIEVETGEIHPGPAPTGGVPVQVTIAQQPAPPAQARRPFPSRAPIAAGSARTATRGDDAPPDGWDDRPLPDDPSF